MAPAPKVAVGQVIEDLITQSLDPLKDELLKHTEKQKHVESKQTENQKRVESLVKDVSQKQAESSRRSTQLEEKLDKTLAVVDTIRKSHEQVLGELRDTKQQLKALQLLVKESQSRTGLPNPQQAAVDGSAATSELDTSAPSNLNNRTDASRSRTTSAIVPQKRSHPEADHEDVSVEETATDAQHGTDAGGDVPATSETPMQPPATTPYINRIITDVLEEERLLTSPPSPGTLRATSLASSPATRNQRVDEDGDAPMIDDATSMEDQSVITVTTEEKTMWRASWYGAGKPGTLEDFVRERKKELNANNRGRETRKASRAGSLLAKPPSSQNTPNSNRPSTSRNEDITSGAHPSKRPRTTITSKKNTPKPTPATERPSTSSSNNQDEQLRRGSRQKRVPARLAGGDFVPSANIFDNEVLQEKTDNPNKPDKTTQKAGTGFQPVNKPTKSSQAAEKDDKETEQSESDIEIPARKPAARSRPQASVKDGKSTTKPQEPKKPAARASAADEGAQVPTEKPRRFVAALPAFKNAEYAKRMYNAQAQYLNEQAEPATSSSSAGSDADDARSQAPAAQVKDVSRQAARSRPRKDLASKVARRQPRATANNAKSANKPPATATSSSSTQPDANGATSQDPAAAQVEDMLQEAARSSYVAQEENVNVVHAGPAPKATTGSLTSLPGLLSMFNPRKQKE